MLLWVLCHPVLSVVWTCSAHDLEVDEFAARPEEDRLTAAEKNERINKQLQVSDPQCTVLAVYQQHMHTYATILTAVFNVYLG